MKFANSLYVVVATATGMANRIGIGIAKSLTASHGVEAGVEAGIGVGIGAGAGVCAGVSIYGG